MRKYGDNDRLRAVMVRDENRRKYEVDYPGSKKPRRLVLEEDGKEIYSIKLIPHGMCNQWLAGFPNGTDLLAGMTEILKEFKRHNPPALSVHSL